MNWCQLLNTTRHRPTTSSTDPRSEFERDLDRSIFSTPVKRLQDKAQVFPLEAHDGVRTRLTHSLEVSSVARGLAARTAKWLLEQGEISRDMARSIEAIAATCGLIHDIGNPPFGHAGEEAIRVWFKGSKQKKLLKCSLKEQQRKDFSNFEGNAQSLRLVAKLQVLADFNGLNLTYGTLSALSKYVASSGQADRKHPISAFKKPGYFVSEASLVEHIRQKTGTGQARNPISFLVEAADDIVYLAADIEDAVKKGVLSWKQIREHLQAVDSEAVREVLQQKRRILTAGQQSVHLSQDDATRAAAFRTAAVSSMAEAAFQVFIGQYERIMQGIYPGSLLEDSDAATLAKCLRRIGQEHVYPTLPTLTLELMGRRVIGGLMDVFWEGAEAMPCTGPPDTSKFAGKAAALFSPNYRQVFQHSLTEGLPKQYYQFQLVTDQVCGMTDSFAKRLHAELFNGR